MASTPKVTNYQHSEIPPWKIELIQRKKQHQGTMSPNTSNVNNGINNSHRSITHPESDVNTDKSLIDSTSTNGGSLVATKIHAYTKPKTQIQHIASVILNGSNYNSSAAQQMDGALTNSMEDGTTSIAAGHSHFQQKTMNASTAAQPVTINTNVSTQAMNNPIINNSVTDASVAFSNMEVGAPQPAQRKIVETKTHSIASQLNFRHGSDHIVTDKEQFSLNSNSSLNDRKPHLVSLTTTKCIVPNNKCVNTNKSNKSKYFRKSKSADEASNSNDIVCVAGASESTTTKNRESEDWFPSKRNSLNLLAEQHQKLERELGRPKMVSAAFDESEDLQYGPGIVSKLRCRYLSLALRQTIKQRPTLDNLRRTNSLSNLLDEEDEEHCDGEGIDDQKSQNGGTGGIYERISAQINDHNKSTLANNYDNSIDNTEYNSTKSKIMPTVNAVNPSNEKKQHFEKANESNGYDSRRQLQRGNDSLKRARSVEALMRYDTLAWRRDIIEDSEDYPSSNPIVLDEIIVSDYQSTVIKAKTAESITIEDKIQQARDRMNDMKPPRRLTSFMSDTERPPPDLVKQTLLKFEASANRRPRGNAIQRYGNGDVAAKIANFKSNKIATYKSKMSHDSHQSVTKLPPSGFMTQHKPMIKPRTTSPKPPAVLNGLIKKPTSFSNMGHENGNNTENENPSFSKIAAKSIDVERMNQKNAFSTMRFDTKTYRNRTEIPSPQSPVESASPMEKIDSPPGYVHDMVRKRETNSTDFEAPIVQLSRKTEQLHLNAPKPRSLMSDVTYGLDDTGIHSNTISDNDEVDNDEVTSNSSEQGCSESYDVNTSDNDDNDFNHKFHVNKRINIIESSAESNGAIHSNQIKPTSISVPPLYLISNGSSSPFDRTLHESMNQPEPSVRQIGIIRPLMTESKPPPVPIARKPLVMAQKKEASISSDTIKVSVSAAPIVVSTQHSVVLPSTTSSVVVTNSVSVATENDTGNDVVVIECSGDSDNGSFTDGVSPTNTNGNCRTHSQYHSDTLPVKTISIDTRSIVHQKNLLNKEKSEEVLNNGSQSNGSLTIQSPIKWNIKKSTIVSSSSIAQASSTVTVNQSQATQGAQTMPSKSRPSDIQTTNTMVFNFSDRKDVPDYIENDGLVIRRKRELPKPGESGFVLLGDLTVETSTDPEPDDTWICDPPSPCDVQFKNANVIVNGKSSLRDKSRSDPKQLSIRFNDVLTSTFEYPSEGSLCDEIGLTNRDAEFGDVDSDALLYNNGHFLGNSPIASVPLGNYQPIKATIFNTNFELGVTRAHHPPAAKYQAPLPPPRTHSQNSKHSPSNETSAAKLITSPPDNHYQQLISIDGTSANAPTLPNGVDSESLQYLKPASDDQTVAWSEGASDLLF